MNIVKIFDGLWQIDSVYPLELLEECQQQDIASIPWSPLGDEKYTQAHLPRRVLTPIDGVFLKFNQHVHTLFQQIKDTVNLPLEHFYSDIWADYPGYYLPMHLDNDSIQVSMQVYLNDCDTYLGTEFNDYQIPYKANSGYLMINTPNMLHGMLNKVPENFIRLSSYTRFLI